MGLTPFVHRGSVTLPAELRTPPSLTLHTQRLTPTPTPPSLLTLPLTDEEHTAALAKAACRNTGLVSTFLVLTTKDTLTVGKLDVDICTYAATATITIPGGEECLGCWIADGPTVVARYGSKVVVACESLGCHKWKAEMVDGVFQGVFVAGERVLCVSSGSGSANDLVRDADLFAFPLPSATQLALYSPTLTKVRLPPNFNPHLLTCVARIRAGLTVPYELIYGTSDGRLTCCSHDKIIMEVALEESPLSVTVAEAAHGVAVLVVTLGGMDRRVITLFAESLQRINSWTGVHQVVVADLASTGHDQLLLVTQPPSRLSPSPTFAHVSLLHPGAPTDPHKSHTLASITSALRIRLQDGVKELHAAEHRRSHKMRMLAAACNLMQAIGNRALPQLEMASVEFQASYMDRRFLLVKVEAGSHLRQPTLFATSLQGFVRSAAARLPSEANSQSFLFSFPLKECQFPIHIILAADAGENKSTSSSTWDPIHTQCIHSLDTPQPPDAAGLPGTPSEVCGKWLLSTGGAYSQAFFDALVRGVALQTSSGKERRITAEEEQSRGPLTSMYVRDASVVSEELSGSGEFLEKLWGARMLEMVVRFAELMLEEIRCGDASVVELQGDTDRCFCHLMVSVMYNSYGHF